MAEHVGNGARSGMNRWRIAGWSAAAGLWLLPLVAMQFTDEVDWDGFDFIFAAVLIGGLGLGIELAVRMSRNQGYRAGALLALAAAFMQTWANAAVGIIGSERDPINTMFTGIVVLALLGAVIARFRPAGMVIAMWVTATAQAVAAVIGATQDVRGAVFSGFFVALWLGSAALFRSAAVARA